MNENPIGVVQRTECVRLRLLNGSNVKLEVVLFCLLVFAVVAFAQETSHIEIRIGESTASTVQIGSIDILEEPSSVAHLQLGGVPLHGVDAILAILLVLICLRRYREQNFTFERTPLDPLFGLWFLVGLYELFYGFFSFGDISVALHEFGMIYLAVSFYIAREVLPGKQEIQWFLVAFCAATLLRTLIANWYYIGDINFSPGDDLPWPSLYKFMSSLGGINVLLSVIAGMALGRMISARNRWLVFFYLSFATFSLALTQQRGLFLALLLGYTFLAIGSRASDAIRPMGIAWVLLGALLAGILMWSIRVSTGPATQAPFLGPVISLAGKTVATIQSGDKTLELTGTARWRWDAWEEAWRRILVRPILGEGFGRRFVFYDSKQEKWWAQMPPNTYLTVLYKMGLVGLSVLVAIHLVYYRRLYKALGQESSPTNKTVFLGLAALLLVLQAYGLVNVLFERRSLALVYWSLMGVLTTMTQFAKRDASDFKTTNHQIVSAV